MRPTRNRPGLIASLVIALLAAVSSACTDSPPPAPTASPPPNPTTLTGITISDTELMVVEGETASIVITLDSDPGTDIEVWFRPGRTGADDLAFAPDRLAWAAADWQEPRTVTLTAVGDYFAERLEAHELQVWTYRRGEVAAGQHILATETLHAWITDPRELRALTGGGAGEIVLEWPGWGGQGIRSWQYQYRRGEDNWGAWTDMPNSDAGTRSFRVTGLTSLGRIYQFRVRPWGSTGPGAVSAVIGGYVAMVGADGTPEEVAGAFLEPGRRFRFYGSDFTFVVPEGMLLSMGQGGDSTITVAIPCDELTLVCLIIDVGTGEVLERTVWDAATDSYARVRTATGEVLERRGGVPPPPGHDPAARWEQIEQSIRREPLP